MHNLTSALNYVARKVQGTDANTHLQNASNVGGAGMTTVEAMKSGDTAKQVEAGKGLLMTVMDTTLSYVASKPWAAAKGTYSAIQLREACMKQQMHLDDANNPPLAASLEEQTKWRADNLAKAKELGPQIKSHMIDTAVNFADVLPYSPGTTVKNFYDFTDKHVRPETVRSFIKYNAHL